MSTTAMDSHCNVVSASSSTIQAKSAAETGATSKATDEKLVGMCASPHTSRWAER